MADYGVKFTGDTTGLQNALTQGRNAIAAFSPGAVDPARASLDLFTNSMGGAKIAADIATSSWRENLSSLADFTIVARAAGDSIVYLFEHVIPDQHTIRGIEDVGYGITATMRMVNSAFDSAGDSVTNYFTSVAYGERGLRVYEQQNEGLRAAIGRVLVAFDQYIDRLVLARSGIADLEFAQLAASKSFDTFAESVENANGAGSLRSTLTDLTAELMQVPGLSKEAAAGIEGMLNTVPNATLESNKMLVDLIKNLATTGEQAVELGKKIAEAYKEGNGDQLGTLIGTRVSQEFSGKFDEVLKQTQDNLTDLQVLSLNLAKSLSPADAVKYYDALIGVTRQQLDVHSRLLQQNKEERETAGIFRGLWLDIGEAINGAYEKNRQFVADLKVATAELERQKQAYSDIVAAQTRQEQLEKLINDDTTNATKLAETQANIKLLQQRQVPADFSTTTDAGTLIKHFEGFAANAYKDSDGRYRVGYGSDTTTDAQGNISQVTADTKTTMEAAARDLERRVAEFQDEISTRIGPTFDKLSDEAKASLTSIAYNYGTSRVPSSVIAAARSGDEDTLASAIGALTSNPKRRAEEAANISGGDADDQEKINQRLQEQLAIQKELNDKKAGGTVTDQANLAIATQNAYIGKDEVDNAQKLLDAKKQDQANAAGTGPAAERQAAEAVANAQMAYDRAVTAVKIAEVDKRLGAAQKGSAEEMALNIQKAELEQQQYQKGTAGYIQAQTRIQAAQKAFAASQTADQVSALTIRYDAQKAEIEREIELIKERANSGQITGVEEVGLLRTQYAQKSALDQQYYSQKAALEADDAAKFRADQQRSTVAAQQSAAQLAQLNRQTALQIQSTYKEAFEGVSSSISSSLLAIQQRTGTFRDLMRNAVLSIEGYFLQAGLKMVADWAATQLQKLTITALTQTGILGLVTGGEAAQTAATAAGTAARTGLIEGASLTQMAVQGAAMIKSILSSAVETFAGIFGFLSPVLGPAAAGPALAGQATVAGMASLVSFDVGSWNLPSDMIAQVHRGEMIIPADQAARIRDMFPNGSFSDLGGAWGPRGRVGASGGGEVYGTGVGASRGQTLVDRLLGVGGASPRQSGPVHNWYIQAMDGKSVQRVFREHGTELAKAVHKAGRLNPGLGRK